MRTRYRGKSGRLNDLLAEAVRFFEDKGFLVSSRENDSMHATVSVKTGESAGEKILEVCLFSDSNGSLEVAFSSSEGSPALRNSSLLPLLGGGFLTLRRQKMDEILGQLEKEFWERVDKFMASS